ncbi:MAG: hypothetical protein R3B68_09465 [Phycisphaerales bacterium]
MPLCRKRLTAIIATAVVAFVVLAIVVVPWGGSSGAASGPRPASGDDREALKLPVGLVAIDLQPEVVISATSIFCDDPEAGGEEGAALLSLLGGSDPETSGLMVADPSMDSSQVQRRARLPGFSRGGVMGVINHGGQWAGVGSVSTTEDTLTGAVVARRERMVMVRATALEGGLIALDAELRDENDRNALEVVGRRAGIAIGQTESVADSLILEPGQRAVLRLAGSPMQIVLLEVTVRAASPAPEAGDAGSEPESGSAP